jgi:hypothetical protein
LPDRTLRDQRNENCFSEPPYGNDPELAAALNNGPFSLR